MDSGYYAACAGLVSRMQALDVLANNLANANTDGYKAQREFYNSLTASLAQTTPLTPLNQAMNRYGVIGSQWLDLSEGPIVSTGNPLDVAIQGPGFFTVQTSAGIRYSRNGSFHLDQKRRLVTAQGDPVLGPKGPIQVPAGKVSISSDGTISVNGAMVGNFRMVDFAPGATISPVGDTYFSAPAAAAKPLANPSLQQASVEASNMNPVSGMVSLILDQRGAQQMERALAIFNTDFDKTAESLGRV